MRCAALAMLLCASGCESPEQAPPEAPTAPERRATLLERSLAGPAAFDLAPFAGGATLVWSEPEGALSALPLDALGEPRGEAEKLDPDGAAVREVAAGGELAIAWLHVNEGEAEVRATTSDAAGFEPFATVGPAENDRLDRRGHLAVGTGRGGRLLAFYRGERGACHDGSEVSCTNFGMHSLPARGSEPSRPRLAVPKPCEHAAVGVAVADGRWHYAVCAMEGAQPVTTVFTAQRDPAYAQAQTVLTGCDPYGMTVLGDDVWIVALCGGRRAAVRVRGIEAVARTLDLSSLELTCSSDRPVIDGGTEGTLRAPLKEPLGGIAPLLPMSIAPLGSRAVWTGEALLVASAVAGKLQLARYRCFGGLLLRG